MQGVIAVWLAVALGEGAAVWLVVTAAKRVRRRRHSLSPRARHLLRTYAGVSDIRMASFLDRPVYRRDFSA